jgi:hypothetical protein
MPWARDGDKHVFYSTNEVNNQRVSAVSTSSTASQHLTTSGTSTLEPGMWCQWSGAPSNTLPNGWATNNLDNAHSHVEIAQPETTCCAGVVVENSPMKIKTTGIVLAWVIKKKRTLELSGLYQTSENGVHVADTAIIQRGNFFVMARSKDDELETLLTKFSELVGE